MSDQKRPSQQSWATGWYVRTRHLYEQQVAGPGGTVPALCNPNTRLYPNGRAKTSRDVPLADSPEVMGLPACKFCLRRAAESGGDERG